MQVLNLHTNMDLTFFLVHTTKSLCPVLVYRCKFVLFRMYLPPNSDSLQLLAVICNFRKVIRCREVLHLPSNI